MDELQKVYRYFQVVPLRDGGMKISAFLETRKAAPIVSNNGDIRHYGILDEADQRLCASVRYHREADAPCLTSFLSLVEATCMLALEDLVGAQEHHVVYSTPFASRAATNPRFVSLDDFFRLAADPVLVGAHHADTQLVKNLESGFVARQLELALKLDSRNAGRLAGNKLRTPKPDRKRRVRTFHDRARSKTGVAGTMTAAKRLEARRNVPWLISHRAVRADEAIYPSCTLKILCARSFVWKEALKLRKRVRKPKVSSLKYVDNHDCSTLAQILNKLPLVGGCDNPISTDLTTGEVNPVAKVLLHKNRRVMRRQAQLLNRKHDGDQAIFLLSPSLASL